MVPGGRESARGVIVAPTQSSPKPKADEANAVERRAERDRLVRELGDFVDGCRESDDPGDLDLLRDAWRVTLGAPLAWNKKAKVRAGFRMLELLLDLARKVLKRGRESDPEDFETTLKAIPAWLALATGEKAFEKAVIDPRVIEMARRRERGALQLLGLMAIRTGAWGAWDAWGSDREVQNHVAKAKGDPHWYVPTALNRYVDGQLREAVRGLDRESSST